MGLPNVSSLPLNSKVFNFVKCSMQPLSPASDARIPAKWRTAIDGVRTAIDPKLHAFSPWQLKGGSREERRNFSWLDRWCSRVRLYEFSWVLERLAVTGTNSSFSLFLLFQNLRNRSDRTVSWLICIFTVTGPEMCDVRCANFIPDAWQVRGSYSPQK